MACCRGKPLSGPQRLQYDGPLRAGFDLQPAHFSLPTLPGRVDAFVELVGEQSRHGHPGKFGSLPFACRNSAAPWMTCASTCLRIRGGALRIRWLLRCHDADQRFLGRENAKCQPTDGPLARPTSHDTPSLVTVAASCCPSSFSITGRHGTRLKPRPSTSIAYRPLASMTERR